MKQTTSHHGLAYELYIYCMRKVYHISDLSASLQQAGAWNRNGLLNWGMIVYTFSDQT